jgi:hypothetical protein
LSEFLTYAEAAELLDKDVKAINQFLNRHHVPRYVRREDVMLAKAAAGRGAAARTPAVTKSGPNRTGGDHPIRVRLTRVLSQTQNRSRLRGGAAYLCPGGATQP